MYFNFISRILLALTVSIYIIEKTTKINIFKFIKNNTILFIIYSILGINVLYNISNRDFYLPFLGPTVIPVKEINLDKDEMINVNLKNLPSNKRIIYWAANPGPKNNIFKDPLTAYNGYGNSGITKTDQNGNVQIQIHCPSKYYVSKSNMKKQLNNHIHYRIESDYEGLFDRVKTNYVNC
jgi:hypothetical protein